MQKLIFIHFTFDKLGINRDAFLNRLEKYVLQLSTSKPNILFEFHYQSKNPIVFTSTFSKIYYNKNYLISSMWKLYKYSRINRNSGNEVGIVIGDNYLSLMLAKIYNLGQRNCKIQGSFHGSIDAKEESNLFKRKIKKNLNKHAVKMIDQIRVVNLNQAKEAEALLSKKKKLISEYCQFQFIFQNLSNSAKKNLSGSLEDFIRKGV